MSVDVSGRTVSIYAKRFWVDINRGATRVLASI